MPPRAVKPRTFCCTLSSVSSLPLCHILFWLLFLLSLAQEPLTLVRKIKIFCKPPHPCMGVGVKKKSLGLLRGIFVLVFVVKRQHCNWSFAAVLRQPPDIQDFLGDTLTHLHAVMSLGKGHGRVFFHKHMEKFNDRCLLNLFAFTAQAFNVFLFS